MCIILQFNVRKERFNMALIKCPECGKKVSDMAKACPKCGRPLNAVNNEEETANVNDVVVKSGKRSSLKK